MSETMLSVLLLSAVLIPAAAGIIILAVGDRVHRNVREAVTLLAAFAMATCVFSLVPAVLAGREVSLTVMEIADGLTLSFKADSAGMIFACIASSLWVITSFYSIGYMRGHGEKNQTGYFAAFAGCLCGAIGVCFAADLLTFFIFYEILTVSTYPLVVHYRDAKGKYSGRKYLIYTLVSGQLFFAGMVYVYATCGTLAFTPGGFVDFAGSDKMLTLGIFLLMVSAGAVKAGVMPLHSWLPAAMVAPTPVSALLHAVAVVKAGAFCVIRLVCYTFGPEVLRECMGAEVLLWLAGVTVILSSLIAIQKTNLKARLAFSTVGQLSYIVMGVCLLTPAGMTGAMYHMVAHAFLKITLFMCAGAIFVTAHKADITEMRGIGRRMPVTMAAFTAASLGIAGLPFLPGFLSKMTIMEGARQAGQPVFALILVASALLSLAYLIPVSYIAFAGTKVREEYLDYGPGNRGGASKLMLIPLLAALALAFVMGFFPDFGAHFYAFARAAASSVYGGGI